MPRRPSWCTALCRSATSAASSTSPRCRCTISPAASSTDLGENALADGLEDQLAVLRFWREATIAMRTDGVLSNVADWIPANQKSHMVGDVRHATFAGGGGDAARHYDYEYLTGPLPLAFYRSRSAVNEHPDAPRWCGARSSAPARPGRRPARGGRRRRLRRGAGGAARPADDRVTDPVAARRRRRRADDAPGPGSGGTHRPVITEIVT